MPSRARRSIGPQRNPASEHAILEAAQALLAEQGPGGFTIEAVARRARAGKPTIYRWWPSRANLLLAVFERQREADREEAPDPAGVDLRGRLHHHLVHMMARWRDTPAGPIFRSVIAEAQVDETAAKALADYIVGRRLRHAGWLSDVAAAQADTLSDLVTAYALQRLAAGRLDPDDAELARVASFLAQCAGALGRPSPVRSPRARGRNGA